MLAFSILALSSLAMALSPRETPHLVRRAADSIYPLTMHTPTLTDACYQVIASIASEEPKHDPAFESWASGVQATATGHCPVDVPTSLTSVYEKWFDEYHSWSQANVASISSAEAPCSSYISSYRASWLSDIISIQSACRSEIHESNAGTSTPMTTSTETTKQSSTTTSVSPATTSSGKSAASGYGVGAVHVLVMIVALIAVVVVV
jgi:hypothetical protein